MAKWDFNRPPKVGLPASQLACVAWHCGAQPRDAGVSATTGSVLSPTESQTPPKWWGSCLSSTSPGLLGACSWGPAQNWCGCRFAKGVQYPLILISLNFTVWHRETLHLIISHGSSAKGDCITICFIYVICVQGFLHFCVLAFKISWLWKTESIKCNRMYGSLWISAQYISHSFFFPIS